MHQVSYFWFGHMRVTTGDLGSVKDHDVQRIKSDMQCKLFVVVVGFLFVRFAFWGGIASSSSQILFHTSVMAMLCGVQGTLWWQGSNSGPPHAAYFPDPLMYHSSSHAMSF